MKPYLIKLILVIFLVIPFIVHSQEYGLTTKSKKAVKYYNNGQHFLKENSVYMAKENFELAITEDPEFYEAYMILGDIYEQEENDSAAVRYYTNAITANPDFFPPTFFILANLEYKNAWYEGAIEHYKAYLKYESTHGDNQVKAEKRLANCKFAVVAIQNPVPFDPVNLGSSVNSKHNDYFPCLTADNQTLLFTRLLPDSRSYTGRQEDFFMSYNKNGSWLPAFEVGIPINTVLNEGAPTLSADGNILIFTACESLDGYGEFRKGYGRCDLFVSKKSGNDWTVPYNLGTPVNSRYWESQPSLSSDGRTLYFVSNRHDNYDIWYSRVDNNGAWSEPLKMGPNINTEGYEGSVFIHPDNQTLYFSSDGHVGMGGLDIFVSRKDSLGRWGAPMNLGYPINSNTDDNSIVISADGALAMFASDREDGFGGLDMYSFELYEEARPQVVTYMKGTVFDHGTNKKLDARFELTSLTNGQVAVEAFSNKKTGDFLVCLPTDDEYALTVSKEGYLFYSENISLAGENSSSDPMIKDVPLEPIKVGSKMVLKNIFFETAKYDLKENSKFELNRLVKLLEANPGLILEIGGHTDNVGTPEYNQILSENRANTVNQYLVDNGIDQIMLIYKGYGEANPVDSNETEEGRANNRRTEFRVIKVN